MRLFASWWERMPRHELATGLAVFVAVVVALQRAGIVIKFLTGPAGNYWG